MTGSTGVLFLSVTASFALLVVVVLVLLKLRGARADAKEDLEVAHRRVVALTGADGLAWPSHVAVTEILDAAMRAAGEDGQDVAREVQRTRPVPAAVARDLVVVVTELLDNALNTCDSEDVRLDARPSQDGGVLIEVDDGGGGMDRDQLRDANRALKSSSPPPPDSGLGLFLAGRLAKRHGISVSLASKQEGARATVQVPLTDAGDRPRPDSKPAPSRTPRGADATRAAADAVAGLRDHGEPTREHPAPVPPSAPARTARGPAQPPPPPPAAPPPPAPEREPLPSRPPQRPAAYQPVDQDVTASWTPPWGSDGGPRAPEGGDWTARYRPADDGYSYGGRSRPGAGSYSGSSYSGSSYSGSMSPTAPYQEPEADYSPIFDQVASSWPDLPPTPTDPDWTPPVDDGWTAGSSPQPGASVPFRMTRNDGTASTDPWGTHQGYRDNYLDEDEWPPRREESAYRPRDAR